MSLVLKATWFASKPPCDGTCNSNDSAVSCSVPTVSFVTVGAEHPQDVARLARLAEAKGIKTRAVIKLLGRGAILLTTGVFNLAMWVFWAVINILMLCAAIKRAAERIALGVIRRGKARHARRRECAAAAAAG